MAAVELKKLIMAGPMRWIVLTTEGKVTTMAWFVKVLYTAHGTGTVLFARSDLDGVGGDDLFAVFSDNSAMATHLRDDVFYYSAFAGVPDPTPPAPVVEAIFESQADSSRIVEKMRARDGTALSLTLWELSPPKAYLRQVDERMNEVGAYVVPGRFALEINGVIPVGQAEIGPLAEAPPIGADLQNLWFE
jgi:hypothetical protein